MWSVLFSIWRGNHWNIHFTLSHRDSIFRPSFNSLFVKSSSNLNDVFTYENLGGRNDLNFYWFLFSLRLSNQEIIATKKWFSLTHSFISCLHVGFTFIRVDHISYSTVLFISLLLKYVCLEHHSWHALKITKRTFGGIKFVPFDVIIR